MDKKTCIILLTGFLLVVLFSNNNYSLEGYQTSESEASKELKDTLDTLNSDIEAGTISDWNSFFSTLQDAWTPVQGEYDINIEDSKVKEVDVETENKTLHTVFSKQQKDINEINTSLEKMEDSNITYTEYEYKAFLWAIVCIGLGAVAFKMLM